MNKFFLLAILLISSQLLISQVGINTTSPDASSILDVSSTNKGLLTPRMSTAQRNAISLPAKSLLIFNLTTNTFEYNSGTTTTPIWSEINISTKIVSADTDNQITIGADNRAYLGQTVFMGKFIISSSGNINITGLPFKPSQIKFTAFANVESYNLNSDNGVGNNNSGISNAFGFMSGFATNYSNTINQQVIFNGGNGNSINDISRYVSSSHAIGIRYANQNGDLLGITSARITSFNSNGFTLNTDSFADGIVVLYEAYK